MSPAAKNKVYTFLALIILLALMVTFATVNRTNKTTQDLKLPSGKTVRIQPAWQLKVLNHEPALMLNYETDLKLADRDALRMEADEVWAIFKKDVEAGPFNKAAITAHEIQKSYSILEPLGYRFVYRKQQDGSWLRTENQKESAF